MTTTTKKPFHVISLDASNFKCIEAIHIDPATGKPVVISGDNGAGKSSVLDAIEFALTGKNVETPLKRGAKRGQVTLDLGDSEQTFKITRKITAGADNLILTGPDGASVPKAQTVLNGMFKAITIDPLDFMEQKPKQQAETLKEMLGLGDVLDKLTAEEKVAFDNRTAKNAEVKTLQAQFDAIVVPPGTPDAPVDVVELSKKIEECNQTQEKARAVLLDYQTQEKARGDALELVEKKTRELEEAKKQLQLAKESLKTLDALLERHKVTVKEATTAADESVPLLEKHRHDLGNAQTINQAVANKKRKAELRKTLATATAAADALTAEIEKKRDAKLIAVQNAKLPVEGLEITDDSIHYQGIPLHDQNTATQIRVCCALAMAEKPDVRVLFIREGALANTANKKLIFDIAKENGFQVWMECFSEKPLEGAIHIVQGEIAVNDMEE